MDLLLFLLKLLISWVLLRAGRRRQFLRQRQALKEQASQLARRENSVAEAASAALARTDALKVVATGDEDAVRAERAVQLQAKDKHEARLDDVTAAKDHLVAKMSQFKQQHPAVVVTAAAAQTAAAAAAVVVMEEMRDEKLVLDADKRRTVTLLNAVKARFVFCKCCCCKGTQ